MKRWTQSQDYLALIAGLYACLSPIWTDTTDRATTTMIVLGAITVVLAVVDLFRADIMAIEGLMALMGVLFFVSPWVMDFSDMTAMAWTAWIVGVVTFAIGAADLQLARVHHHGTLATQHAVHH